MKRLILFALATCSMQGATRNYFVGYGQSLSIGNWGCSAISTTQPYSNQRLNAGSTAFVPLIEDASCVGMTSIGGTQESPLSSTLNNLTLLDPAHAFASIANNFGVSGTAISGLKKGTSPYSGILTKVTAAKNIAAAAGDTLVVRAVIWTHGETDAGAGSTTYKADLAQLQSDLEADIKAITGQTRGIPFVFTQVSSNESGSILQTCPDTTVACIDDYTGVASPSVTIAQWQLQRDYPTKFLLAGPKYQFTYGDGNYHLDAISYNKLGATMARVLKSLFVDGAYAPVAGVIPRSITRSGATVTAMFYTPGNLALALDNTTVPDPYRNSAYDTIGKGFQYFQTGGTARTISSVSCSAQTCTITLSGDPGSPTMERLAYGFEGNRYGYTPIAGCNPDATTCTINGVSQTIFPTRGAVHGNVRTVADYTDLNGDAVYHWAVHFNEPIGYSLTLPGAPSGIFPLPSPRKRP